MDNLISMTPRERCIGWFCLPVHILILPLLLVTVNQQLGYPLSSAGLNCTMFILDFIGVILLFRRFLYRNLLFAVQNVWNCLRWAFLGLIVYYLCNYLFSCLLDYLVPDYRNANDLNVQFLVKESPVLMSLCTVFLVPPVEETLYRGLIFRTLRERNRFLAYAVSVCVFSAIHVLGYVGSVKTLPLLIGFLQYLPAGFCLAWSYERSGSLFAPILMHITINQIAMLALR